MKFERKCTFHSEGTFGLEGIKNLHLGGTDCFVQRGVDGGLTWPVPTVGQECRAAPLVSRPRSVYSLKSLSINPQLKTGDNCGASRFTLHLLLLGQGNLSQRYLGQFSGRLDDLRRRKRPVTTGSMEPPIVFQANRSGAQWASSWTKI